MLLNASPDVRQQIGETPCLAPSPTGAPRSSPIKAVVLTNGDVDHVAGLLTLRERQPFSLYGTRNVLDVLAGNSLFNVLASDVVPRVALAPSQPWPMTGGGRDLGLTIELFHVPGKVALYLEDPSAGPALGTRAGDTVGVAVRDPVTQGELLYIPGCARIDDELASRLRGAPLLFFDGTLWSDDEMLAQGLMGKTGARMGHMNVSGKDGSIAALSALDVRRKVFIHLNNSNPLLDEASAERAQAEGAGWEVADDGMELSV